MKKILQLIIISIYLTATTCLAESLIDQANKVANEIYNEKNIPLTDNIAYQTVTMYFYPMFYLKFFIPYYSEYYVDKKYTYLIGKKHPTSTDTVLGVSLSYKIESTK